MADDHRGSRTFLAIVLGGIVLALVVAALFMYGHKGDSGVKVEQPVTEKPAETPPAPPAAEAPALETPSAPPAAEAPAAETPPTAEAPAAETPPTPPAEEAPVEEAPADEAPAEEAPPQ
jgi:hypothetical protein